MRIIKNGPVKSSIALITPEDAADMLQRREDNSRRIDYDYARQIYDDIECGRWEATGDSIVFDSRGMLVNGAIRLYAMVLAASKYPNLELEVCIVTGMDANTAMDRGKPRTTSQALRAAHGTDYPHSWSNITEFLYGLTGSSYSQKNADKRKARLRSNGLHPDHAKFMMDFHRPIYVKMSESASKIGTPSSKQFYKVCLLLLFHSGIYDDAQIAEMAKHFCSMERAKKKDKDLERLWHDMACAEGEFCQEGIDTRPGGERSVVYILKILHVLMNYLERHKASGKRKKVSEGDVSIFLTQQVEMMFQPLYVQKRLEKRMFHKKMHELPLN